MRSEALPGGGGGGGEITDGRWLRPAKHTDVRCRYSYLTSTIVRVWP